MKFRTKPVTKEAWPIAELIVAAKTKWSNLPPVVAGAYENGEIIFLDGKVCIKTLEGWMNADKEDWLICGLKNELYACDPYVFEMTYEKVEE